MLLHVHGSLLDSTCGQRRTTPAGVMIRAPLSLMLFCSMLENGCRWLAWICSGSRPMSEGRRGRKQASSGLSAVWIYRLDRGRLCSARMARTCLNDGLADLLSYVLLCT